MAESNEADAIVPADPSTAALGLDDAILARGWCPHQINVLRNLYDASIFTYLVEMNKNGFRDVNHRQCADSTRCVANNVDMSNYATRHTTGNCACQFVGVDYEKIIEIIKDGGVPLIAIQVIDGTDKISLKVEARTAKSRYTAISHVWFDGLGNPNENALPACQLNRLQSNLAKLPESKESSVLHFGSLCVDWRRLNISTSSSSETKLFWMDTLCIPVKNQDAGLRTQSINQMASIYAAAVQVLVLDAEIEQCWTSTSTACEILARILCSAWMSRSWTFQEGVLGRECVFQFADAAVNPIHEWDTNGFRVGSKTAASFSDANDKDQRQIYTSLYDSLWNRILQTWKSSLSRDESGIVRLGDLVGNRKPAQSRGRFQNIVVANQPSRQGAADARHFQNMTSDKHRVEQLVVTWNELSGRSTTMTKDIHVIVANLLDFNADAVMQLEDMQERMSHMIFSFNTLPVSLFFNTGLRFDQNGDHRNRWLPIEPSKSRLDSEPTMTLLEDHLAWVRREEGVNFQVWIITEPVSSAGTYEIRPSGGAISCVLEVLIAIEDRFDVSKYQVPCIIVSKHLTNRNEDRGALFYVSDHQLVAAQASILEELRLVYHSPVHIRASTSDFEVRRSLEGTLISPNCKVLIEYEPLPNFTALPRRPISLGPFQNGMIFSNFVVVFHFIPALGCLIAFAVIKARHPHNFPPTAKRYLIAAGILWISAFLLPIVWYFATIPLAYREWLRSFDNNWANEKRSWWDIYVWADKALDDWATESFLKKGWDWPKRHSERTTIQKSETMEA